MKKSYLLILLFALPFLTKAQRRHAEHHPIQMTGTFSPDLRYLSTNGTGGYGFIWDLKKRRPIFSVGPADGKNSQVHISPDGKLKLVLARDTIRVSNLLDSTNLHVFPAHKYGKIFGIAEKSHRIVFLTAESTADRHTIASSNIDGSNMKELATFEEGMWFASGKRKTYRPESFYKLSSRYDFLLFHRYPFLNKKSGTYDFGEKPTYYYQAVDGGKKKAPVYKSKKYGSRKGHIFEYDGNCGIVQAYNISAVNNKWKIMEDVVKGYEIFPETYTTRQINADFSEDHSLAVLTRYDFKQEIVEGQTPWGVYDMKKGWFTKFPYFIDARWTKPRISADKSQVAVLFQDYQQQGAAVGFYDPTKNGEEIRMVYLQYGPAFEHYVSLYEAAEKFKKEKEKQEAYEQSLLKYHCMGYKIIKIDDPRFDYAIFYTGIVSFKSERKQSDLQPGVTCKCGSKEMLEKEIQILKNTAKEKKAELIVDASLISNWEIFRD